MIKKLDYIYLFTIAFLFVLLFSFSTSPLYLFQGCDSCIFKIVGRGIAEGKVLYKDIFDHKGPLLFFIQALGTLFSKNDNNVGILSIQIINLFVILLISFRISIFFQVERKYIYATIFLGLMFLSSVYGEGNQCEEWELPYILLPLYYVFKDVFLKKGHPLRYAVIYGSCLAVIVLIRMNDVAIPLGVLIGLACVLAYNERCYRTILNNVLFVILGFVFVCIPFFLYFWLNDCLYDAWYGIFEHNLLYSSTPGEWLFLRTRLTFIFIPAVCTYFLYKENKKIGVIFLPAVILGFIAVGKNLYSHYLIVFFPYYIILAFILIKKKYIVVLILYLLPSLLDGIAEIKLLKKLEIDAFQRRIVFSKIQSKIPLNERDSVWNYNCVFGNLEIFQYMHTTPINAAFIYKHIDYSPYLQSKEYTEFCQIRPKYILSSSNYGYGSISSLYFTRIQQLMHKNYRCIYKNSKNKIYLWKRIYK